MTLRKLLLLALLLISPYIICAAEQKIEKPELTEVIIFSPFKRVDIWTTHITQSAVQYLNDCDEKIKLKVYPPLSKDEWYEEFIPYLKSNDRLKILVINSLDIAELISEDYKSIPQNTEIILCDNVNFCSECIQTIPHAIKISRNNIIENILLIRDLWPNIDNILIIAANNSLACSIAPHLFGRKEFFDENIFYLTGDKLNEEEIEKTFANLPKNCAVLYHSWISEDVTNLVAIEVALDKLAAKGKVPIIGFTDVQLKSGKIVGGAVSLFDSYGKNLGKIIQKTIHKTPRYRNVVVDKVETVFDYRLAQRYGILNNLPKNTILVNMPESYFSQRDIWLFKSGLIAILAICGTILFAGLYYFHRKQAKELAKIDKIKELILSTQPSKTVVFNSKGKILFYSDKFAKNIIKDHKKDTLFDLHDYDFANYLIAQANIAVLSGIPVEIEFLYEDKLYFMSMKILPPSMFNETAVICSLIEQRHYKEVKKESNLRIKFLEDALFTINEAIIIMDKTEKIVFVNQLAQKLTGYSEEEILGQTINCLLPKDSEINLKTLFIKDPNNKNIIYLDNSIITKNGKEISVESSIHPFYFYNQVLIGATIGFKDTSIEKSKRRAMIDRERIIRNVADLTNVKYFLSSESGSEVTHEHGALLWKYDQFGNPLTIKEVIFKDDYDEFKQKWDNFWNERGTNFNVTYRIEKDNKIEFFNMKMSGLYVNGEGESRKTLVAVENITEFIGKNEEIYSAYSLFELMFNNLPTAVYIKDIEDDFRYLAANKKFIEIVSFKSENIVGKKDVDIFTNPTVESKLSWEDHYVANNDEPLDQISWIKLNDGETRAFKTLKCKLDWNGKKVLLGVSFDVTELKSTEQILRETTMDKIKILDNIPIPVLIFDPDQQLENANIAAYNMLGKRHRDVTVHEDFMHIYNATRAFKEGRSGRFYGVITVAGHRYLVVRQELENNQGNIYKTMISLIETVKEDSSKLNCKNDKRT